MALMLGLSLALSACGGSSGSDGSSTSATETTTSTGETVAKENQGSAESKKILAPYIGHPSPFPVTEKLKELPTGAKVVYVNCGAPFCNLIYEVLQPAAKTLGLDLTQVKSGYSAEATSSAFDTVVAEKPDAVIVFSGLLELWTRQLKELQEAGTVIVTSGISEAEKAGIEYPQTADKNNALVSKLFANYVMAEMSPEANVVVYNTPELPFANEVAKGFSAELKKICSGCSVRSVDIPISEDGTTAPNTIVTDLQANPDTTVAFFPNCEAEFGLPAALAAAGIEVETLSMSPEPTNLQYIKEGKATAGLATDVPVIAWTMADLVARQLAGQKPTGLEAEGIPVYQFLRQEDITFDPSKGWSGYPDFAERFAKLWGIEG